MKKCIVLLLLVVSSTSGATQKMVPSKQAATPKQAALKRDPSSIQCEALFQTCVSDPNIDKRAKACHGAVQVCKNRFSDLEVQNYNTLERKCSDIEREQTDYSTLRADFCRISLIQYLLSN